MKIIDWIKVLALVLVSSIFFTGCGDLDLSEDRRSGEIFVQDTNGDTVLEDVRTGEQRPVPDTLQMDMEMQELEEDANDEEDVLEVSEASLSPLAFLLMVAFLMSGCMTWNKVDIAGNVESLDFDSESGSKANATAQITGYSRGGVQDGAASEGGTSTDENWTDAVGGGEVSANTAVGESEASQEVKEEEEPEASAE